LPWLPRSEDTAELAALGEEFDEEHAPVGPAERRLVERIVGLTWKLRRLAKMEYCIAWTREHQDLADWETEAAILKRDGDDVDEWLGPYEQKHGALILMEEMLGGTKEIKPPPVPFMKQEGDKARCIEQLAQWDIRFGGQLLSATRQLSRLREQRLKQEREQGDSPSPGTPREASGSGDCPRAGRGGGRRPEACPKGKSDGEELPWERGAAESIERQELRQEYEQQARVDREEWKHAIELARAEGETIGREKALAEMQAKAATVAKQEPAQEARDAEPNEATAVTRPSRPCQAAGATENVATSVQGSSDAPGTGETPVSQAAGAPRDQPVTMQQIYDLMKQRLDEARKHQSAKPNKATEPAGSAAGVT
jgi:hypothetical protein